MSLTKQDLNNIESLIIAHTEPIINRIDRFEERMERRLSEHDQRFDVIEDKIDQLSKRENEDIVAVVKDIEKIKIRLKKAEANS